MANRAQRRAIAKQERHRNFGANIPPTKAARLERIMAQGISPDDLAREYKAGFDEGFKKAAKPTIENYYAATILALHTLHGFGQKRCIEVLNEIESNLVKTLTSTEISEKVMDEVGIKLDWDEPFERAQEK